MFERSNHDRQDVSGAIDYPGEHLTTQQDNFGTITAYANHIAEVVTHTQVTQNARRPNCSLQESLDEMLSIFRACHKKGNKIILVGNGGSSAIASHVAIDFCKNGGMRAVSFNDFPSLTCLSNDFGYENVFSKQIEYHAHPDDCLVCISTGGKSMNIRLAASAFANLKGRYVFTFTGMKPDNALRSYGYLNFYSPSYDFGIVEIAHLTLLHSLVPCTGLRLGVNEHHD